MMTTTTPLRAATITRTLKKLGYEQSQDYSSNIRGWGNSTKGFEVEGELHTAYSNTPRIRSGRKYWPQTSTPTGRVFVSTTPGTHMHAKQEDQPSLTKIADALKAEGYTVELDENHYKVRLVVTR